MAVGGAGVGDRAPKDNEGISPGARGGGSGIQDHSISLKFILAGECATGKTSIMNRLCENRFDPAGEPTIGAGFSHKIVQVRGTRIKLQIWDTAGQERFRSVIPGYFRGSAAIFFVFDVTRRETLDRLVGWIEDANDKGPENVVRVIVGNKSDLGEREVSESMAREFGERMGISEIVICSAASGERVEELFLRAAERCYDAIRAGKITLNNPLTGAFAMAPGLAPRGPDERGWCC